MIFFANFKVCTSNGIFILLCCICLLILTFLNSFSSAFFTKKRERAKMWCLAQNTARICPKSNRQVLKLLKRQVRAKANVGIGKNQILFPSRSPEWSDLTKPLLFTVGFSTVAMAGSAIWKYENERQKRMKRSTYTGEFWKYFENLPPKPKAGEWRQQINTYWNSLREGQKIVAGLLIANTAVFILWQIPAMTPFMMRYFVSSPVAHSKCIPMLLCAFSHQNFMHFGFNMYALSSFAPPVCEAMGKELFLGFYMTAAIVSSMTSLFYKVNITYRLSQQVPDIYLYSLF